MDRDKRTNDRLANRGWGIISTLYDSQSAWLWSARHSNIPDKASRPAYGIPSGWWGGPATSTEVPQVQGLFYESRPHSVQVGAGTADSDPGPDRHTELS